MKNVALISNSTTYCHQLEAPELRLPPEHNPVVLQETVQSTHPVPCGQHSILSELKTGELKPFEAYLLLTFNHRSCWDNGKSWNTSYDDLHDTIHMSIRYIRDAITSLMSKGWLEILNRGGLGTRYQILHHNCDRDEVPTDKNGNPLKFAVPHGKGGPLERVAAGDISWKAALIWILLKLHSDWATGTTHPVSLETLRQWAGMSPNTVSECIKELTEAGMLKRLTKKHVAGVYQLYPKPNSKPKPLYRKKRKSKKYEDGEREMRCDGDWRFSFNELWRINVSSGEIQTRRSRGIGLWKPASDYQIYQEMPKPIKEDFDLACQIHHSIRENLRILSNTDTADTNTDTAQSHTDGTQRLFEKSPHPSGSPPS